MIRNVVMGRLNDEPGARDQAEQGLAGIVGLDLPGLLSNVAGWDEGLREGGWSFALTNDWVDAEAYRRYDLDPEHHRYRAQIAAVCEQVARVQFTAPDPD